MVSGQLYSSLSTCLLVLQENYHEVIQLEKNILWELLLNPKTARTTSH